MIDTARRSSEIVLALFLQKGAEWTAIRGMREQWQIEPVTQLPPAGKWPGPFGIAPAGERPGLRLEAWWTNIEALVCTVIPNLDESDSWDWNVFLANCVLYDPPDDQLCEFVKKAGGANIPPPASREDLPDPVLVESMVNSYWNEILKEMGRRLAPSGIDTFKLFCDIIENPSPALQEITERKLTLPPNPYIRVTQETTKEQALATFRQIAAEHSERPKPGRSPRDPLIAVQCAILREKYHWTNAAIGKRFNWAAELPAGRRKPFCDTAYKYIRDGKRIMRQDT